VAHTISLKSIGSVTLRRMEGLLAAMLRMLRPSILAMMLLDPQGNIRPLSQSARCIRPVDC
jgi:hypothetical protein